MFGQSKGSCRPPGGRSAIADRNLVSGPLSAIADAIARRSIAYLIGRSAIADRNLVSGPLSAIADAIARRSIAYLCIAYLFVPFFPK